MDRSSHQRRAVLYEQAAVLFPFTGVHDMDEIRIGQLVMRVAYPRPPPGVDLATGNKPSRRSRNRLGHGSYRRANGRVRCHRALPYVRDAAMNATRRAHGRSA